MENGLPLSVFGRYVSSLLHQNFHFETLQKPTHTQVQSPKRYKYKLRTSITKTFFPTTTHTKHFTTNRPTSWIQPYLPPTHRLDILYKQKLWIFCVYSLGICLYMILCADSKIAATLVNVTLCFVYIVVCDGYMYMYNVAMLFYGSKIIQF